MLTGYPPEATAAYLRFQASGDAVDLEEFLLRALDFLLEREPAQSLTRAPMETRLREDLGADSLLLAELVFLLEELFAMELSNASIAEVATLADLRRVVERGTRQ